LRLDIIHAHSPFLLGQLGASFARRLRVPLVFTYHTLYDQYIHYAPFAQGLARKAVVSIAKKFCNRCNLVVTPTWVIRRLLQEYGVHSRIVPIPTGIEPGMFEGGDPGWLRHRFQIGAERQILLFVGRLSKEKNLDSLFRIFGRVVEQNSRAILVLAGSGPDEVELHQLAGWMGIGSRLVFTGRLSRSEVASAYSGADLFVFPSVTETQGLVLVEAMAAGLVVVARSALGSEAIVEDGVTGFLCPDEDGFAERILMLLRDPGLRERVSAAATARARHLASDLMAIRLEKAYQALLGGADEVLERMALERP
jgi:glycosyltransferase involved in cell wall biosynthesis